ncbi:hypothetical protein MWU75_09100 [Ornithinimicrobium sp. F0845]|uniref:hypothetical protein n=1 Tax=Ornithinimicrobium sp. F0845 TaxID=2926412 RepID=UPI001FF6BBE8|nr:hypothetical protein [Ornithinimicrobium sp. F0845]MCK0112293.1 hypothetical protein [Ornithinimicrobium sp. F0845]
MRDPQQEVRALAPAERREMVARELGARHHGVARLDELYDLGLTYDQVLAETSAGRWHRLGRRSISLSGPEPGREASWSVAVWESGSGAVLDGPSSLLAAGLRSWEERVVHISMPRGARTYPRDGVRVHEQRRMGRTLTTDPPRTAPEVAVVRAAGWATSDRQALTVLAMSVQQRIVLPRRLLGEWESTQRHRRGALLAEAIPLVCDGAHALGELDFARACRRHGLPEPSRQTPRRTSQGLIYLDVWFDDYDVHAEINGAQHYAGLGPVADARRRNDRTLASDLTIEIPVLGLLVDEAAFLAQIAEALRQRGWGGRTA